MHQHCPQFPQSRYIRKGLYLLLPFYPFTHEKRLPDYEADERQLDGLAWRQPKIMKGVDRTMGGVILDYEAKRILNRGIAQGEAKGRAEGELRAYIGLVRDNIMEPSVAAARLHISEREFRAKCDAVPI